MAEMDVIAGCVGRVRRRLGMVRLLERIVMALGCAGVVAVVLMGARFLCFRYFGWAVLVAGLPFLAVSAIGYWAWRKREGGVRISGDMVLAGALAAGLSLATMVIMCTPVWPKVNEWLLPAVTGAVYLLAAVLTRRRVSAKAAAVFVDRKAGLQERVATAYEWGREEKSSSAWEAGFRAPLLQAAADVCTQVQMRNVKFGRLQGRAYAGTALALAAAVGGVWLSPLPAKARAAARPNMLVVQQAKDLAAVLKALEQQAKEGDKKSEEGGTLEPLKGLVQELKDNNNMTNLEAMDKLQQAQKGMEEMRDKMNANQEALKSMQGEELANKVAEAAEKIKQAQVDGANGEQGAGAEMQKAQEAMKAATDAAGEKMASGQMTQSEKEKMASALKDAADKAAGGGQNGQGDQKLAQSLGAAASAAQSGDGKGLSKNLADAGNQMAAQAGARALSGEKLQEAMNKVEEAQRQMGGNPPSPPPPSQMAQGGGQSGQNQDGANGGQGQNGQQGGQSGQGGQQQAGGGPGEGQPGNGGQPSQQEGGQGQQQASAGPPGGNTGAGGRDSGSTEFEQKGGSPGDNYHGRDVGKQGTKVRLYDSNEVKTAGATEKATGVIGQGPSAGSIEVMGQADKNDGTLVDYSQQLPAARKLMEDQMNKQMIPPQYRDLVRQYYDGMK